MDVCDIMIIRHNNTEGKPGCLPGVSESVLRADRKLTASAVQVYVAMAELAASTGRCFAAVSTIAQRAVKSRATVQRAIGDLTHHGYLVPYLDPRKKTRRGFLLPSRVESASVDSESPGDRRRARDLDLHKARKIASFVGAPLMPQNLRPKEALTGVGEENTKSSPSCVCAREGDPSEEGGRTVVLDPNSFGDNHGADTAPLGPDPAVVAVLDATLRSCVAGASLGWGMTDQAACSSAMQARFGPNDRSDSLRYYGLACSLVAGGDASAEVFREAMEIALKPGAVRPGAVFASHLRKHRLQSIQLRKDWMFDSIEPESETQRSSGSG